MDINPSSDRYIMNSKRKVKSHYLGYIQINEILMTIIYNV
jgi:hypothetical protein